MGAKHTYSAKYEGKRTLNVGWKMDNDTVKNHVFNTCRRIGRKGDEINNINGVNFFRAALAKKKE